MSGIKRMVLDVLKPHDPGMVEFTDKISDLNSVTSVNSIVYEVDEKVVNIKLTVVGEDIDYDGLKKMIEKLGGSVHSVDEVVAGESIVEDVSTPQD